MSTIGLCMIAKNESDIIVRCLESARPMVDYVMIEDTGSTDGTQSVVRRWLDAAGLPGDVYEEPWKDFAYNRSHALSMMRKHEEIDYALILDADDYVIFDQGFDIDEFKRNLFSDLYDVELRDGSVRYRRPQLCRNDGSFRYRGVLHEFLQGPVGASAANAAGFYITSTRQGARNRDPEKYRKDAHLLERALQEENDEFLRSRYTFYLAKSYLDAGEKEKAFEYFLKRAEFGYWTEEIFISLYSAAQIKNDLGRPFEDVLETYLAAGKATPDRAEAWLAASRLCRENGRNAEGYEYARRGLEIPLPAHGLFVEPWCYDYGLLDELAVNAYWVGQYRDSFEACQRLLTEGKMPEDMRERVTANLNFAADKLRLQGDNVSTSTMRDTRVQDDFLFALLRPERLTTIVDIGANPIDSIPPYKPLLSAAKCRVIGFEPQPKALAALNALKTDLETYLPDVLGDGTPSILKVCRAGGMTSLLAPNEMTLRNFSGISEWCQVVEEIPLETRRLDDITEIEQVDFLKMDVQGAEKMILENGRQRLNSAVAIQIEVSFIPLYESQPTFGEIDIWLRDLGFVPHCFVAINKKLLSPLPAKTSVDALNQLFEADVLYVRDFTKPEQMSPEQLKHLAVIAHYCYGSFDLSANCIQALVAAEVIPSDSVQRYVAALEHVGLR